MRFATVYMLMITINIFATLILSQYEAKHGELDGKIKPFLLLTFGFFIGYVLRLLFLN